MKKEYLDVIEAILSDEYARGYNDGTNHGIEITEAKDYEQGLNDAWECARKIFVPVNKGGLRGEEVIQIFNSSAPSKIFDNYSALEAIAKIKEYEKEQKQTEIKFGDILENLVNGYKYIALRVDEDGYVNCIDQYGRASTQCKGGFKIIEHNPQIEFVFEKIRE